jgi:hypothetical protein
MLEDPYVKKTLLTSTDPVTKTQIWMAPPPFMTSYLRENGQQMSFPPRFGQNNKDIYTDVLGYPEEHLKAFKEKEII